MAWKPDIKYWKGQLAVGLVIALRIGTIESIIAARLTSDVPRLTITAETTNFGGQSVSDVRIDNAGDLPLASLHTTIRLQHPSRATIDPPVAVPWFTSKDGLVYILATPRSYAVAPGGRITIRFTSSGPNAIVNQSELAAETSAVLISERTIAATGPLTIVRKRQPIDYMIMAGIGLVAMLAVILAGLTWARVRQLPTRPEVKS